MKIKLSGLPETLYTPDGRIWTWDAEETSELYYVEKDGYARYCFAELLSVCGEVSTEPYPREFKVGDRIDNEQDALAMPVSAVILDCHNFPLYKANHGRWYKSGIERPFLNSMLKFPATILWLPQDKEAGE